MLMCLWDLLLIGVLTAVTWRCTVKDYTPSLVKWVAFVSSKSAFRPLMWQALKFEFTASMTLRVCMHARQAQGHCKCVCFYVFRAVCNNISLKTSPAVTTIASESQSTLLHPVENNRETKMVGSPVETHTCEEFINYVIFQRFKIVYSTLQSGKL